MIINQIKIGDRLLVVAIKYVITTITVTIINTTSYASTGVKTNINQVTDLFDKEIQDKRRFEQRLESDKLQAQQGIADKAGLKELQLSEDQVTNEATKLDAINANDLENKGLQERAKKEHAYYGSLEVDYSSPQVMQHKKDVDLIVNASNKLVSRLIEGLKELDIDCRQVKGNQEIEPEYHIEIHQEPAKDTIYDQTFCEHLRNSYSCIDELVLQCLHFAEQVAELTVNGSNMKHNQAIAGSIKRISFAEKYGSSGEVSSYGGGTVCFGLINKSSGTTYSANEANWYIDFNVATRACHQLS